MTSGNNTAYWQEICASNIMPMNLLKSYNVNFGSYSGINPNPAQMLMCAIGI